VNEKLEEQAALYTLGLLEGSERAEFERQLESDRGLRDVVDRLDETAAQLAHQAPPRPLPPELREKILAAAGGRRTLPSSRRQVWIPWAIAASLALFCAYAMKDEKDLRRRIKHLRERDFFSQIQIVPLDSKLESAPRAGAVVVWDGRKQRGVLRVTGLPPNDDEHDYQLWLIDPRYQNPVNGGVFHFAASGPATVEFEPATPVREAKGFAVSLERKGGVAKAAGPILLEGK
jgi:anti-sigma-K factor RskA